MNKIAIFTSGDPQQALAIYDFFKEGNRVGVDCIISDNINPEAFSEFATIGIPVFTFPDEIWNDSPQTIINLLKERNISLIVLDNFSRYILQDFKEAFPGALLNLHKSDDTVNVMRITPADSEVIISDSINNAEFIYQRAIVKALTAPTTPFTPPAFSNVPPTPSMEEAWAEKLNIKYSPENHANSQPFNPNNACPPESPRPPFYRNFNGSAPDNHTPGEINNTTNNQEPIPNSYLLWSILSLLFCCFIPAIVAIFYSSMVSSKYYAGDIEGSKRASDRAQLWIIISIVGGIISSTLYLPFLMLLG